MKKVLSLIAAALVLTAALASCKKSADPAESAAPSADTAKETVASTDGGDDSAVTDSESGLDTDIAENDDLSMFSDGDRRDVTTESADATVILAGSEGTISDTARGSSGSEVTIRSKGVYHVVGMSDDVTIKISDNNKSGNIYLILDNVTMTNSSSPCIYVEDADKVVLQCVGANSLTFDSDDAELDGAIYAKDDITVNGTGSLAITSSLHGVVAKNDLKLIDVTLDVDAQNVGVKAGDSVRVSDAGLIVKSGRDGVQIKNDSGDSFLYFESGSASITSGGDGIDVGTESGLFFGYVSVTGGSLNVTAGGGSDESKDPDVSAKGIKCDGNITIGGDCAVYISAADDAVNSGYNVEVNGGTLTLLSSDDGVHAANAITVGAGVVGVMKSYEGLEASYVTISGGDVSITSSDDGINAGGGSDDSPDDGDAEALSGDTGAITVSGGTLYVNAQGDGLDSNGSISVTDGVVIIEAASSGANSALDKGDGTTSAATITGGTVLAIGSNEKAINFDGGTQCSALLSLSGSAGTKIAVGDGSGFAYTATKDFSCVLYSSPMMQKGSKYKLVAGKSTAEADFTSSLLYSDLAAGGR